MNETALQIQRLSQAISSYRAAHPNLDLETDAALATAVVSAIENAADMGIDENDPDVIAEALSTIDELGFSYTDETIKDCPICKEG